MNTNDAFKGPSFSFKNRLARVAWGITAAVLFRFSPKPFFRWRSFLLICFGARIGKRVHIYPKTKIWAPWNLDIGDESGIANDSILYSQGKITIGRRTVVSQGAHLVAGTHDYTLSTFPLIINPIHIGDNVWIAAEAFIHPGIKIGDGCVIGARSVVTKDMPAWMVCSGHPCAPLKKRILID